MTSPIPAPPARVVDQLSGEVAAGITPVVREIDSLRADLVEQTAIANALVDEKQELREKLADARTEVERLRSHKSLPMGMVWQDYYSPDDVLKIRGPLDEKIDTLNEDLHDMREDRDMWADRADKAERELARLQEQQVRVDEQASRIQALEQALAAAVAERDTARAGMAGRGQK